MLATVSEKFRAGLVFGIPFPQRPGRPDEYAQLAMSLIDHDYLNSETIRLVLQPHLWRGASGCVVAPPGAGLVSASPA